MTRERNITKVRGTARVKKFDADQDETVEEPMETIEREFELTEEQIDQIKKGGKIEIINGKPQIKE